MTESELAFAHSIPIRGPLQRATLAARIRTGRRLGTQISAGRYDVVVCHFALGKNGQPKGGATVEVIKAGLTQDEAIAVMEGL